MSMWKRQEIQKVSRRIGLGLLLAASLNAAILPEKFGPYQKSATTPVQLSDTAVWQEYGFKAAERAEYRAGNRQALVTAWRLGDPTGAVAAAQWLQPGVQQYENYVLRIEGSLAKAELEQLQASLPDLDRSAMPTLPSQLPARDRVKGSERYLLGPASLAQFEPRVSSELVAFNKGAEAQLASYRTEEGEARLLLISYPTPQIAGERLRALEKLSEWKVRRKGPMVAVVIGGAPAAANTLLGSVTYEPQVSWTEYVPKLENPGEMLLSITVLAGILIAASIAFGLFFGGALRFRFSRFGVEHMDKEFTSLNLDRRGGA